MLKIVCIGSGRLATQLMPALEAAGGEVVQIYNRSLAAGTTLAAKLRTGNVTTDITALTPHADIYILAVADDAIPSIAEQLHYLENEHAVFVHCSGVLTLDVIPCKRRGVFYPLQSFSYQHDVDWHTTPLLVTGSTPAIAQELFVLARRISAAVYIIKDADKAILHMTAVWANNFTNHMLVIAEELCRKHGLDFSILHPIIRQTFEKALDAGPAESQTGPALRGDRKTMERHAQMLEEDARLNQLYQLISASIASGIKGEK
jgi:predicted short-subunit dehydrogenase-like oxidoreductase (DUF2520 family)